MQEALGLIPSTKYSPPQKNKNPMYLVDRYSCKYANMKESSGNAPVKP
jgi:hypothetical protein